MDDLDIFPESQLKGSLLMFRILTAVAILALTACAGKVDYIRPTTQVSATSNIKIIDKPRDTVWNAGVPALGKQFFVINNLDKASGLINVSYSGNPEKYIDCGRITSYVKNASGERTYDFPGATAQQDFQVMLPSTGLFNINRKVSLDGRVNLVFEELSPTQTRITANTKYIVKRDQVVQKVGNTFPQSRSDSISFNSGSGASFPGGSDGRSTECVSTGSLEREILSAIN